MATPQPHHIYSRDEIKKLIVKARATQLHSGEVGLYSRLCAALDSLSILANALEQVISEKSISISIR